MTGAYVDVPNGLVTWCGHNDYSTQWPSFRTSQEVGKIGREPRGEGECEAQGRAFTCVHVMTNLIMKSGVTTARTV